MTLLCAIFHHIRDEPFVVVLDSFMISFGIVPSYTQFLFPFFSFFSSFVPLVCMCSLFAFPMKPINIARGADDTVSTAAAIAAVLIVLLHKF